MNKWRLIVNNGKNAYDNMAIDMSIMKLAEIPTVRFYRWRPPAVSIGCFQSLEEEVDIEACKRENIDCVRRITGGGAVFHDDEITYSISIKEKNPFIPEDLHKSYEKICQAVIAGFKNLGINAQYAPLNDIIVGPKKISGCAQTRRGRKLLQHGTLLSSVDADKMFSLLKVGDEKIKDKFISDVRERVTSIENELEKKIDPDKIIDAFVKGFESYFGIKFVRAGLSEKEKKLSQKLKEEKFTKDEWNYSR